MEVLYAFYLRIQNPDLSDRDFKVGIALLLVFVLVDLSATLRVCYVAKDKHEDPDFKRWYHSLYFDLKMGQAKFVGLILIRRVIFILTLTLLTRYITYQIILLFVTEIVYLAILQS